MKRRILSYRIVYPWDTGIRSSLTRSVPNVALSWKAGKRLPNVSYAAWGQLIPLGGKQGRYLNNHGRLGASEARRGGGGVREGQLGGGAIWRGGGVACTQGHALVNHRLRHGVGWCVYWRYNSHPVHVVSMEVACRDLCKAMPLTEEYERDVQHFEQLVGAKAVELKA